MWDKNPSPKPILDQPNFSSPVDEACWGVPIICNQYQIQEIQKNQPKKIDADQDGLSDDKEKEVYKTDPNKKDTDEDGLSDWQEIVVYKTDPLKADTDNDGIIDMPEFMSFIARWKDDSNNVPKAEVEGARAIWFDGGGY